MAIFFLCGCPVTEDSTAYDCGAASHLPVAPAATVVCGATTLSVGHRGSCFVACPCGNVVFMHTVTCAYYGARGALVASSTPAAAAVQTNAAAYINDGGPLSLTRDGLCVVSSCVRPRNDTHVNDEVVIVAENVKFLPM